MNFETTVKVRFSDVDRAGIAYYPNLVHYLHVAFEEFFEGFVGVPYATVLERDNLGFPAVALKMDFHEPLRFGEEIRVQVAISHLGRTSIQFRYRLVDTKGKSRAEARVTVVCVALDTLEPQELPEPYRGHFARAVEEER